MFKRIVLAISIFLFIGCTTFHGLKPLTPGISSSTFESRPHFKWKPSEKEGVKYDFVIYEMIMKGNLPMPGKTVYYKEGLEMPEYKLEHDLEKNKGYLWTVRVRDGEKVGQWSRYDFEGYFVYGYVKKKNWLYQIQILGPSMKGNVGSGT